MIRTKTEVNYENRNPRQGIVAIEVTKFFVTRRPDNIGVVVTDYVQRENENGEVGDEKYLYRKIHQKTLNYTKQEIQGLYLATDGEIPKGGDFVAGITELIDKSLMHITLNEVPPTYGNVEWEQVPKEELIQEQS